MAPFRQAPGTTAPASPYLTLRRGEPGPGFRYNAAVTNRPKTVLVLLLLLLVAAPLIAVLPDELAATRLAGLSILWWYAGVVAPLLAGLVVVAWLPDGASKSGVTSAVRLLAVWLTPAVWLEMPALIVDRGPGGLWVALALILAPLIALCSRSTGSAPGARESLFPVMILLLTVAVLLWADMILAGDVAAWLGAPRWQGIAIVAAGGFILTGWRGGGRIAPVLLLATLLAVSAPLAALARAAGVGPLGAWARVASQATFRFAPRSPWVTTGRDLSAVHGRAPIVFDEEHRLTGPAGGRLQARVLDGGRVSDLQWTLSPGQSVTLRPGDRLQTSSALRVRFEADKRVPGSPPSGIAWAAGGSPDLSRSAGLLITVLFGAMALLRAGTAERTSRSTVAVVSGGLLVAFLWAQCWAIYSILAGSEVFLGGVTPERLLTMPPLGGDDPARPALQVSLLAGGFVSFVASSIALRERLGALDRTGSGEIGYDLGLWAGVFAIAALASLWTVDSWFLTLLALGAAASSLGPATMRSAPPAVATIAGVIGFLVFASLSVVAGLRDASDGVVGAVLAYPAMAAVPVGAFVLWIGSSAGRR